MCEFISWGEYKGKIIFLTDTMLTGRRGKELREYETNKSELVGHGSLAWYYGLKSTDFTHHECTDFTNSNNFPVEISAAVKDGIMTFGGLPDNHLIMLSGSGKKTYKARQASKDRHEVDKVWQEADKAGLASSKVWQAASKAWHEVGKARKEADGKIFWEVFSDPANRSKVWR